MKHYIYEYDNEESVKRYVSSTAGKGIGYLLANDYAQIYTETIRELNESGMIRNGVRILEYGCGGGMNLIHLVNTFEKMGVKVDLAIGTDYSIKMVEAAREEAVRSLDRAVLEKVHFFEASNETLLDELSQSAGLLKTEIRNSFHLVVGINTFRYCWRIKEEHKCARHIQDLLTRGGISIVIDMNNKFPYHIGYLRHFGKTDPETGKRIGVSRCFRKVFREKNFLPNLEQYAKPFRETGFTILREETFCWISHSSKGFRFSLLKSLTPVLNALLRKHAMRVLVIARK